MGKTRKKITLVPGHKYDGKGWINEYGQTFFEAKQKLPNENNMKSVIKEGSIAVYESKNCVKVSLTLEKQDTKTALLKSFIQATTRAGKIIKEYEFTK